MGGSEQLIREELLDEEWFDLMQAARKLGITTQEVRIFLAEVSSGLFNSKKNFEAT